MFISHLWFGISYFNLLNNPSMAVLYFQEALGTFQSELPDCHASNCNKMQFHETLKQFGLLTITSLKHQMHMVSSSRLSRQNEMLFLLSISSTVNNGCCATCFPWRKILHVPWSPHGSFDHGVSAAKAAAAVPTLSPEFSSAATFGCIKVIMNSI